jgi:hypothetical protein
MAPFSSTPGAGHRVERVGGDHVAASLVGDELSPVNGEPVSGPADQWGRLTHGPHLSVPLGGVGVKQRGAPNILVGCFGKGI